MLVTCDDKIVLRSVRRSVGKGVMGVVTDSRCEWLLANEGVVAVSGGVVLLVGRGVVTSSVLFAGRGVVTASVLFVVVTASGGVVLFIGRDMVTAFGVLLIGKGMVAISCGVVLSVARGMVSVPSGAV